MTIDFFSQLPPWPSDPFDQQILWNRLKALLTTQDTAINNALVITITLSQATLPTQGEWETAWTGEGYSLPIPPSARLLWYDTANGRFGGVFGTLDNDTTVYARGSANSPGSTSIMENSYTTFDSHVINYNLGTNSGSHPSVNITSNNPIKLYLTYSLFTELASGSGSWGADFLINSTRVGVAYYGLASTRALIERTNTGQIIAMAETPILDPGDYIIQGLAGRTNATTPTLNVLGVRALSVRGVVQP